MADLNTKGFDDLVSDQVVAIQAASTRANLDFSIGSALRAIVEGWASLCLWLQALILRVLTVTRLATSTGSDVDSFVGDFGVVRLVGGYAAGDGTFSRSTTTTQAIVPVGGLVKSVDGAWSYTVVADAARPSYSADQGGYVMDVGVASLAVPLQATVVGVGGNAGPGGITLIASSMPGIDAVTNASTFSGGADQETDAALRIRFVDYLGQLSKGTRAAVSYAISQVQAGLFANIVEQQDPNGATHLGSFYVVVDDGTGAPSSTLLDNVGSAIEEVRALGISFSVIGPTLLLANVAATLALVSGANRPTEVVKAATALTAYLGTLPLGTSLPYTRLAQVIYDASPNITGVSGLTLNGSTSDLAAAPRTAIRAGTITVA